MDSGNVDENTACVRRSTPKGLGYPKRIESSKVEHINSTPWGARPAMVLKKQR